MKVEVNRTQEILEGSVAHALLRELQRSAWLHHLKL